MPDLPISQLGLLGQAGQEQVEELLVHVVAHLVQNEPANYIVLKFAEKVNRVALPITVGTIVEEGL